MTTTILLVGQTAYNPYVALARDILKRYHISYHEIDIDALPALARQAARWPQNTQAPTLFIAHPPGDTPPTPEALAAAIDPASRLIRPANQQLEDWLHEHGFLPAPYRR